MALPPAEFAAALLREAKETHPWLHHRLFRMIWDGQLTRRQLQDVIRQQGCFFLDTLRHAAWKIISVGGYSPIFEDLERQRALIPLVVEEGGEDTVGGKTTAHAYLFIRVAESLGISRGELFATEYLPTTIIEKNELFLLQRSSTVEALCGGNIATESINPIHVRPTAEALEKHYGVPRAALAFYHVHMEIEEVHADRAIKILETIAVTDEEQSRGRLAMLRATGGAGLGGRGWARRPGPAGRSARGDAGRPPPPHPRLQQSRHDPAQRSGQCRGQDRSRRLQGDEGEDRLADAGRGSRGRARGSQASRRRRGAHGRLQPVPGDTRGDPPRARTRWRGRELDRGARARRRLPRGRRDRRAGRDTHPDRRALQRRVRGGAGAVAEGGRPRHARPAADRRGDGLAPPRRRWTRRRAGRLWSPPLSRCGPTSLPRGAVSPASGASRMRAPHS